MIQVRRFICLDCGNTEKFYVESRRECIGAILTFDDEGYAELDDSCPNDVEIFSVWCANCKSDNVDGEGKLSRRIRDICDKCQNRFVCLTEKSDEPCIGFKFKEGFAELL